MSLRVSAEKEWEMLKKVFVFLIAVAASCPAQKQPPGQMVLDAAPQRVRDAKLLAVYRNSAPVLVVSVDGTLKLFDDHAHVAIMCRKFNVDTQKPSQCVVLNGGNLDEAMARIIKMLETSNR